MPLTDAENRKAGGRGEHVITHVRTYGVSVTEADLNRLPTGQMGWTGLVDYVLAADDRVERYFLEVKSEVDLNSKRDQAKVAKYILGAANRDPAQAERRFGGHALMVLGVGNGQVVGVPSFEAKDLALTVQRLIGVDGPRWDFERILMDGRDVIIIVVDPPTGDVWTCRSDGDGLTDGGIYVRADGETRRATGDEIRALIARATSKAPSVDIDVSIEGEILAIQVDEAVLRTWIQGSAAALRKQVTSVEPSYFRGLTFNHDVRSEDEFLDEVESWKQRALESPVEGVVPLAGRAHMGIRVRLINHARTFLRDVRLDLIIEEYVIATDWSPDDDELPIDLFPNRPVDWGKRISMFDLGRLHTSDIVMPQSRHGILGIRQEKPPYLTMHMDSLRPEETHVSDDDEVVLLMFSAEAPSTVTAQWRVTAQDINDVFEGTVDIPVKPVDWRELIQAILHGGEQANDDEQSD